MTTARPVPYDLELHVITAWNGSGTPIVFSSRETCEELLSIYDNFRADSNMPWVYNRGAVNGDKILDMFKNGLRPWKVYLNDEIKVISVRPVPLHHVTLTLVTERYDSGAPMYLEIWAANKEAALAHTTNLLSTSDKLKLLCNVDPEWRAESLGVHSTAPPDVPQRTPPQPTQVNIPGFGNVLDLNAL